MVSYFQELKWTGLRNKIKGSLIDLTYYHDHSYPMAEFVLSQLQFGVLLDLSCMCKKKLLLLLKVPTKPESMIGILA